MNLKAINSFHIKNPWVLGFICIGIASVLALICVTLLGSADHANIVMVFLLSTFIIAITLGRLAAIYSAFINVAFFDFFFVTPRFSFSIDDSQYLITFAVMLLVGLVTGNFAAKLKSQVHDISVRQELSRALQALSQGLFSAHTNEQVIEAVKNALERPLSVEIDILASEAGHQLKQSEYDPKIISLVIQSNNRIYQKTGIPNADEVIFFPISTEEKTLGVLVAKNQDEPLKIRDKEYVLSTAANLIALAIARIFFLREEEISKAKIAAERLRSAILSSISHDLRTPLTTMVGLAESLSEKNQKIDSESKAELETIRSQGLRLSNMIGNLLEMAKLQTKKPTLNREWQLIEDVVGASIKHFLASFPKNVVKTKIDSNVPPLLLDEVLVERVIWNLLENAAKYSTATSTINIDISRDGRFVVVKVVDEGIGFNQDPDELFHMFSQGSSDKNKSGMGLGLAISKEIIDAHGGFITAENNVNQKGSCISFSIPVSEGPSLPKP